MDPQSGSDRVTDCLEAAGWLRSLAMSLVGNAQDADDLVQDTWVAALAPRNRPRRFSRAWLAGILRNQNLQARRSQRRRRLRESKVAVDGAVEASADPMRQAAQRARIQKRLAEEIHRLDNATRSVVVLRYFDGLSATQIARRLKIQPAAVRQRLQRARQRLRARLSADLGQDWRATLLAALGLRSFGLTLMYTLKTKVALLAASIACLVWLLPQWQSWQTDAVGGEHAALAQAPAAMPQANANSGDGVDQRTPVTVPAAPAAADLDPARVLSGWVVDTQDQAVANAMVTALLPMARQIPGLLPRDQNDRSQAAQTMTEADGSFAFDLEELKCYDLHVEAAGYADTWRTSLYAGEQLRIVLPVPARLSGVLRDAEDDRLLAGVTLEITPGGVSEPGAPRYRTNSDQLGRFQIDQLPPGYFKIRIQDDRYPDGAGRGIRLAAGEQRSLDLKLTAGTSIRGSVQDATSTLPIADALVQLGFFEIGPSTRTKADGTFVLHGAPRNTPLGISAPRLSLSFRAPGYGAFQYTLPGPPGGVSGAASGGPSGEAHVALLPARQAHGRVLDAAGNPLADAYLNAMARVDSYHGLGAQIEHLRTRSDANGDFVLEDLRPDLRHSLLIAAPGHATAVFDFPAEEWESNHLDLGDLVLEPPASLSGRVLDPDRQPMPGLRVSLSAEPSQRDQLGPSQEPSQGYASGRGFGFGRVSARTDARGRFAFTDLPSGNYSLWAGKKGFLNSNSTTWHLAPGENARDLEMVVQTGLSLAGVVRDPHGVPVPGLSVNLGPPGRPYVQIVYNFTGPDGTFRLDGIEPGSYSIWVHPFGTLVNDDGSPRSFAPLIVHDVVAGTQDLNLVVQPSAITSGRVLGPDGQAVHGAIVCLTGENGQYRIQSAVTDVEGRFQVEYQEGTRQDIIACPPNPNDWGQYRRMIDAEGKVDFSYQVTQTAVLAGTQDLILRLPKLR